MILWWIVAFADSSFLICNVIETEAWYNLRSNLHNLQRKLNRQKKTMLLFISDDYGSNLENLRTKILVPSVVSISVRAHVICSRASSSTSTPSGDPSPTWSGRPRTSSLCPPLRCATNTSWRLKRLWLVSESYTCAYIDYLTCFLKEGYFLREKKGEIRSAEIRNCGGRKNDYIDMTLVIFCDIN